MSTSVVYSSTFLDQLSELMHGKFALETPRGKLFLDSDGAVGIIVLSVSVEEYLGFVKANPETKPNLTWVVPCENRPFHIVVMVPSSVEIRDGKTFVAGREVTLL